MADTPKTINVTPVIDQQAFREFAAYLDATLAGAAKVLQASVKRIGEQREVGTLFALRQRLQASTDEAESGELAARLQAALDGYDTAYLAELVLFGRWLDGAAGARPVWESRKR